ncbi:MAG: hypothetical protein AAF211_06685 [Myxococcota bacterium]
MVTGLLLAFGARVVCEPATAVRILEDARIDEVRAPQSHPQLVPGLARRSAPDSPLAAVLAAWCTTDDLSVRPGASWEGPEGSAYEIVVTRAQEQGCALLQERLSLSVGISPEGPQYRLLDRPPPDLTPTRDCADEPEWREVSAIGRRGPVLLRLLRDRRGQGRVVHSEIEVWWASPAGWTRQTLARPAPRRYLTSDGGGPAYHLGGPRDESWVVASHDRTDPPCHARTGQTVWQLDPTRARWTPIDGRSALTHLARSGEWQLAGDDGWFLVLAQDEELDEPLLRPRMRRMQRRVPEPLHLFRSADFPRLNPGYLAIAPGPWPDRAGAEAFLAERPRRGAYVKQAWSAPDPCGARKD